MKIPKNEFPAKIKISGIQLEELQKQAYQMVEAFGLDRKIENYKGTRAISLYRWDLECILGVLDATLKDKNEYSNHSDTRFLELQKLNINLINIYKKTW